MNLASIMAELHADPETFLRHYVVSIAGGAPNMAQPFEDRGMFRLDTEGMQAYQGFQTGLAGMMSKTKTRPMIRFTKLSAAAAASAGDDAVEAWYVRMLQRTTETLNRHTLLPGSGGPDIAFTSQLSGCTFSVGAAGADGGRFVAHIQPPQGVQPTAADYQSMRDAASLGRMETIFDRPSRPGATAYGDARNRATIIGVRSQGNWSFFAQTYNTIERRLHGVERLTS
jgi:hypothetical protein